MFHKIRMPLCGMCLGWSVGALFQGKFEEAQTTLLLGILVSHWLDNKD